MPHPTASIIAQASTEQLKEYLLGFTEEAAILAVRELVNRGEPADQIIQELEHQLQLVKEPSHIHQTTSVKISIPSAGTNRS